MLRSMYIDLDSYFASVEQQENRALRGKPIIIVPMMVDTTSALAASIEAKKYGIRTGTLVADAKRICPEIILVQASHTLYIKYHHAILEAVESVIHIDAVRSIDEMSCELIGSMRNRDKAINIANDVKRVIREQVGSYLGCSVGIAPNMFLSKTASDMGKPDGLKIIDDDDLPDVLLGLELQSFCGIGRRMYQRLWKHGIYSVDMLLAAPIEQLRAVWGGIEGDRFWHALRGHDVYRPPTHKTTIGHSRVLAPALRTMGGLTGVLHRQLQKASLRLRAVNLVTAQLHIGIRCKDGYKWKMDINITPTQDIVQLTNMLTSALNTCSLGNHIPMKVSVALNHLSPQESIPVPMFDNTGPARHKLNQSMDALVKKYGKSAIYISTAHDALDTAPTRIAFNHIPDLDIDNDE